MVGAAHENRQRALNGVVAARRHRAGRISLALHRDDLRLPALVQEWAQPLTIVNFTLIGLS